jgi:glyoxylase-like metal-dependent hydrolase (beta-lactamase superfamily II)
MPSHTVGFQTVLVETRRGPILIASDMLPYFDNWTGRWGLDHIPSGIFEDSLHEYYTCFDRIEEIDPVVVLPGVNPRLAKQHHLRISFSALGRTQAQGCLRVPRARVEAFEVRKGYGVGFQRFSSISPA